MGLKIVITGPESTGKSQLTRLLAALFDAPFALEFARSFLEQLGRPYEQKDLLSIAKGQTLWNTPPKDAPLFFCDTDLLNIKIWSNFKYKTCAPEILELIPQQKPALYLLCDVDLPWESDPLREHPHQRKLLFDWHLKAVQQSGVPYQIVSGVGDTRLQQAQAFVRNFLMGH